MHEEWHDSDIILGDVVRRRYVCVVCERNLSSSVFLANDKSTCRACLNPNLGICVTCNLSKDPEAFRLYGGKHRARECRECYNAKYRKGKVKRTCGPVAEKNPAGVDDVRVCKKCNVEQNLRKCFRLTQGYRARECRKCADKRLRKWREDNKFYVEPAPRPEMNRVLDGFGVDEIAAISAAGLAIAEARRGTSSTFKSLKPSQRQARSAFAILDPWYTRGNYSRWHRMMSLAELESRKPWIGTPQKD